MRTPLCLLALALAASAHADPLIYEGELGGADPFAAVDLRFTLHDAAADGEAIWTSDPIAVALADDGHFVAEIEAGPAGALQPRHFAGPRWLQVTVLPAAGGEVPLAPRQRIGRVPLSFDGMTLSGPDGVYVMRVDCPDVDDPDDVPLAGHYASIHDALAWLTDKRIAADSTVEIRVVSRTCYEQPPIVIAHPDGDRLHILGGEPERPLRPDLQFTGDGVVVADGAELGLLQGFEFIGVGERGYGVEAINGGRLTMQDISLSGFERCVSASYGGIVIAPAVDGAGVSASDCTHGFIASSGAMLRLSDPRAIGNRGYGFHSVHSGVVTALSAEASDNGNHGFFANQGAHMYCDYSYSHNNAGYGFAATSGGTMDASATTAQANTLGYYAASNSYLGASSSYSIENVQAALWAERGALLRFPCEERGAAAVAQNPGPPPPAHSIIDAPAADDGYEAIYTSTEGIIIADLCPGPDEDVSIRGDLLRARGFLQHPDAP